MSLKDDIKDVPSWVWLGGAAAAGVLLFLHARTAASGSAASVPLTSGNGQVGAVQSGLTADGTLPSQYNPPASTTAAAAAPLTVPFAELFARMFPASYGQPGQQDSIGGTYTTAQDNAVIAANAPYNAALSQMLGQVGQQDPAYQQWLQQAATFGPGGSNAGNFAAWNTYVAQGQAFAQQYGGQAVPVLGNAEAIFPNAAAPAIPAAGTGGGGYSYHPDATQTGSMSDAFGLQSPTNPSIHG